MVEGECDWTAGDDPRVVCTNEASFEFHTPQGVVESCEKHYHSYMKKFEEEYGTGTPEECNCGYCSQEEEEEEYAYETFGDQAKRVLLGLSALSGAAIIVVLSVFAILWGWRNI